MGVLSNTGAQEAEIHETEICEGGPVLSPVDPGRDVRADAGWNR